MTFFKNLKRFFTLSILKYIFGRFLILRKISKILNKVFNNDELVSDNNNFVTVYSSQNEILDNLYTDGVSKKIKLKNQINNYILNDYKKCKFVSKDYEFQNFGDLMKNSQLTLPFFSLFRTINGNKINTHKNFDDLFDKISRSKNLLDIAKKYLGNVSKVDINLTYSAVVDLDDSLREKQFQTVNWHYDVHSLNFLYVFFYITDTNRFSGAHQMIKKSHKKKSLFKHLIGSAIHSNHDLRNFYNKDDFYIIEGTQGEGFFEDTSCFHRALKPKLKPRLCLQLRYH